MTGKNVDLFLEVEERVATGNSQESLGQEYGYHLADKLLLSLFENALITREEFAKIRSLNIKSFSPQLGPLMTLNP